MKKNLVSSLAISIMFLGSVSMFSTNAYASDEIVSIESIVSTDEDTPKHRMTYIYEASSSININTSGTATVKASVTGYNGTTTNVSLVTNLQQYKNGSWVTIKTFNSSSASYRTSLSDTYSVSKGYSYRVQTTVKAYSGSDVETRTVTSSTANY